MKNRNLLSGVLLVAIGVVALLSTLDVINIVWRVVWRFWPLLLIIGGIAALPINEYVKTILVLVSITAGVFLYQNEVEKRGYRDAEVSYNYSRNHDAEDEYEDAEDEEATDTDTTQSRSSSQNGKFSQVFSEAYDSNIKTATLSVDFGAGELELKKPCKQLAYAKNESDFMEYKFQVEAMDDNAKVIIEGLTDNITIDNKDRNTLDIALSNKPIWNFDIEMGAADFDFDFSPYKVNKIDISSGVCDMDIKLGSQSDSTYLMINSGVSDIEIDIPKTAGCRIINDSAIVGKDFKGFEKIDKGEYQTENLSSAAQQITIELNCAMSSITINRY